MENLKIAIIGAGNMGGSIARGLAGKGYKVTVSDPAKDKIDEILAEYPVISAANSNTEAVKEADIVILAVKPYLITTVVDEIKDCIDLRKTLVGSLAPTIPLADIAAQLSNDKDSLHLIKIIPNTAIAVCHSMTFIAPYNQLDAHTTQLLQTMFSAMGSVAFVAEKDIPAVTALCSCGIAYAFRYMRAATEGAVELGIRPAEALLYEIETLKGACELLLATGNNPETEIDKVTTPGGITIKGLNAMERYGFTTAVIEGLKASTK